MKKARALSFIRYDRSENNNIFVFFQNKRSLLLSFLTIKTFSCVNKKYVPTITRAATGNKAMTTAGPFTYKAIAYPLPNNRIANIVNQMEAFGSLFPILSPLIKVTNLFVLKTKVTKIEIGRASCREGW